jgi:electron transfer flavoprotein alpha subunit
MMLHSRHIFSRLATSSIHPHCFASTLVLAEQTDGGKLAPVTLNTYVFFLFVFLPNIFRISRLTAANQLKQDVDCVIFGSENTAETVKQLQKFNNSNIKKIFVAENAAFKGLLSESVTPVLLDLQKKNNYTHILGGSSTFSKGILPRLAALLDVQPISDITKIIDKDQYMRFIYAGNAILKLKSKVEKLDSSVKNDLSEFVSREVQKSDRPELPSARIVCIHIKLIFCFFIYSIYRFSLVVVH